ncbi:hypothetical protein B0H16DRAFT_125691 [Mycena metata]|uniref:Uncharacterized protein n=1 Tax=Mycena metata TaxID=1033252 RepID=A0AAD7I817_9AGAR|nr:hypothetical protein B0H16DRAFT_125691 [Mycena metata]
MSRSIYLSPLRPTSAQLRCHWQSSVLLLLRLSSKVEPWHLDLVLGNQSTSRSIRLQLSLFVRPSALPTSSVAVMNDSPPRFSCICHPPSRTAHKKARSPADSEFPASRSQWPWQGRDGTRIACFLPAVLRNGMNASQIQIILASYPSKGIPSVVQRRYDPTAPPSAEAGSWTRPAHACLRLASRSSITVPALGGLQGFSRVYVRGRTHARTYARRRW